MGKGMSSVVRALVVVVLAAGSSVVLVRAAALTTKYNAEVQRLRQEWRSQQQAEGLTGGQQQKALYGKYPTPQLTLAKVVPVAPGQSAKLSVTGKFAPNTAFLMENDQITLADGAATGSVFTASVTAAPDATPGFGRLFAYAPVSGAWTAVAAVFVGTPPTFDLAASNGWVVKLVPQAKAFSISDNSASVPYVAEFYKPGETAPFETAAGSWTIEGSRSPSSDLTLSLNSAAAGGAMAEMEAIQRQMGDVNAFMKMTDAQRDALMARLEKATEQMSKDAEAMMADPAAAQRKQDAFGCHYLRLEQEGTSVSGNISCGKDIGSLQVTGARK